MSEYSKKSVEENEMDKVTTEFADFICDQICIYPNTIKSEELLADVCDHCAMGDYICKILNLYNHLNDFDKTQSFKLLQKIAELEAKCQSETKNLD